MWNASTVHGYSVEASDGNLGAVSDFLFSTDNWRIKWLVVDTGNWLPGRKVLVDPSVLGKPDPARREFPVKLTKRQVKNSPDIATDEPVSRQAEAQLYRRYGWHPTRGRAILLADVMAGASGARTFLPEMILHDLTNADLSQKDGDPDLRSIGVVTGCHVHAIDGEIGHVEDLLIEEIDWAVRYIKVDTSNWWDGNSVLISPTSVLKIDSVARLVTLDVNRQTVKDSPSYDASLTVDGKYHEKFQRYRSAYRL